MSFFVKTFGIKLIALLLFSLTTAFNTQVFSQGKIVYAEYFVDVDPGFKKASPISIAPGINISDIPLSIDTANLKAGVVHFIGLRALDEFGAWSNTQYFAFYLPATTSATQIKPVPKIIYAEFFSGNDPGLMKATPITISSSTDIADINIAFDTSALKPGINYLTVRALDENGGWSLGQTYQFYKPFTQAAGADTTIDDIVYAEYFIDNDPGLGKATALSFSPSKNLQDLLVSLDITGLQTGIHTFILRARNSEGAWSLSQSMSFFRFAPATDSATALPKIVYAEYFVNNDPGYNRATSIAVNQATDLSDLAVQIDTSLFVYGPNVLTLRAKDENGKWSLNQVHTVFKLLPLADSLGTVPQITYMEYYIDDDPGMGKATPVAFTAGTNVADLAINIHTVGYEVGNYVFYLRGKDTAGNWSLVQKWPFQIQVATGYVLTIGAVPDTLCAGQKVLIPYTVNAPFGNNNIFKAQLSNASGSFASPIDIGTIATKDSGIIEATIPAGAGLGNNYRIRVLASVPFDTSEVNGNPVTINRAPVQFNISGNTLLCKGTENYSSNYTESSNNNVKYQWQLFSGGILTANNNNASVNWTNGGSHILKLTAKNYCGIKTDSLIVSVADTPLTGPFSNMLPSDSNTNLSFPINFSWFPVKDAVHYDIYFWPSGQTRPVTPWISNLTGINYTLNGGLDYEKYYKWQIVAKKACYTLESPVQTFQLRYLPDLIVNSIQLPVSAFSGQDLSVTWEIKNVGQGSTLNKQWYDLVYLSHDNVFDNADLFMGSKQNLSALGANGSYIQTATFKLPQGINDNYYIFVHTNPYQQVQESQTNNNRSASAATVFIQLTPPPDLRVTSVVAPNFAFSNLPIDITFTVANQGTGATRSAQWYDHLYLTKDSVFNAATATYVTTNIHYGELDAGEDYSATSTIQLPEGILGKYFVFVVTDFYNQVYEHASENNNRGRSDSIDVRLTPPIDLVVTDITIPATVSNSQLINVKWKVENAGGSSTAGKAWSDYLYLSKSPAFHSDSSQYIGALYHYADLDAGAGYNAQLNVTIPANITGNYYLYVFTDATKSVFEYIFENNNILRSQGTMQVNSPDVVVTAVNTPAQDSSGNTIPIAYAVKNMGPGTLANSGNSDKIFISSAPVYNAASVTQLALANYSTGQLLPGDSIVRSVSVKLPNGLSGNHYFYIMTDASNAIFEAVGETNNTTRSNAINIVLSPWPDLVVDSIQIPDTATAGDVIPIIFDVVNKGTRSTVDSNWTDEVYLSPSPTFNASNAIKVREVIHSRPLQKDSMYTVVSQVKIPGSIATGNYYAHVTTDSKNIIYEHTAEGNNTLSKGRLHIKKYPPVDLVVYDILAPASANSGRQVSLTYQVKNQGVVQTLQGQWNDAVYLSADAVWDANTDVLVKDFIRRIPLMPGQNYTASETLNLPNGLSGSYYLLVVTDVYNVNNDINRVNNVGTVVMGGSAQVINITLSPSSDLVVSSLKVPDEAPAGQPIVIHFKVKNMGVAATDAASWTDRAYLSTNLTLDGTDQVLGSFIRSDSLRLGEEYEDSLQAFLPVGASGNYVIIFKADANDKVYEHAKEQNNTAIALVTIVKPPLSDIVVTDIAVPLSAVLAGSSATINWKVKNIGANPALGYMKEAVYLSLDTIKDISDVLLQSTDEYINLPAGGSADHTITNEITGVSLQDYFVLIHTDVLDNIVESNDTNNISYSANKLMVTVPQLVLDVSANQLLKDNKEAYYRIEIPEGLAGESLLVTLKGDSVNGSNEMYIRYAEVPTRVVYDQSHSLPYEGNQEVIVPVLKGGTYYLMIYGNTAPANDQNITVLATILPFEIRTVNTNKGGNTGLVTVLINGSKFADVTKIRLVKNQNALDADSIRIINPTKLFATFNLTNADLGDYDVVAENEKLETATLVNGFEVLPGSALSLQTSLITPPSTRPSNIIGLVVQFTNSGNIDIIHPTIILNSLGGSPLAMNVSDLDNSMLTEITLHLQEINGPAGVLRPGASGSITVYTKVISALMFSITQP